MWQPLESYFRDETEVKMALTKFFSEGKSLLNQTYFTFLQMVLDHFRIMNTKVQVTCMVEFGRKPFFIQANEYSFIDLMVDMEKFKKRLSTDRDNRFFGIKTISLLVKVENELDRNARKKLEKDFLVSFFCPTRF